MEEKKDKLTQRIVAITALISALTPLIMYFVDKADFGNQQIEIVTDKRKEELKSENSQVNFEKALIVENTEKLESEPGIVNSSHIKPKLVIDENSNIISESGKENALSADPDKIEYSVIRNSYVLKEQRYLPFDDDKLRLYPMQIDTDDKVANITIKDKVGNKLTNGKIKIGEFFKFKHENVNYMVELLGVKSRLVRSNVAYFSVYKSNN